jgi:hypothetical protein
MKGEVVGTGKEGRKVRDRERGGTEGEAEGRIDKEWIKG